MDNVIALDLFPFFIKKKSKNPMPQNNLYPYLPTSEPTGQFNFVRGEIGKIWDTSLVVFFFFFVCAKSLQLDRDPN